MVDIFVPRVSLLERSVPEMMYYIFQLDYAVCFIVTFFGHVHCPDGFENIEEMRDVTDYGWYRHDCCKSSDGPCCGCIG